MTTTAIQTASLVHDGYFTVADGKQHRTFRIHTQPQDAAFAPGKTIIAYLAGSDNTSDYINFAFVGNERIFPWKRFTTGYDHILAAARYLVQGNHEQAGKMYAQASGNCYRCNRLLTTPESVAAGLGPYCRNK